MDDSYNSIPDLVAMVEWMRASADGYDKAVSVFLRPRIRAAQGDHATVLRGLARELLDTTDDEGVTASMLLLEIVRVPSLRARSAEVPGVLEALIASFDSRVPVVRRRALSSLTNVADAVAADEALLEALLTRVLPLSASTDEEVVDEVLTILSFLALQERYEATFLRLGGLSALCQIRDAWTSDVHDKARVLVEHLLGHPSLALDDTHRDAHR
jgi:hypothetical protein